MRTMVDSTNIIDDPLAAQIVLYYCDGAYAVSEATVRARFPNAILVPCSAVGSDSGIVGDVEPGCMTIPQAIAWVVMRRSHDVDPTLYCNEMNTWAPLRAAFVAAGVPEPHYGVADYDDVDVIPPGAVFKQDKNSALTGGHFDQSVVLDYWPGVDGLFNSSQGELDMASADQILAAVTMPLPPVPARLAAYTAAQLDQVILNSTWDGIASVYGTDSRDWLYLRAHPIGIGQAIANLKVNGQPATVDLSAIIAAETAAQAALAAIKAEEDALKAQVTNVEANLNAPRPPA